jgi:hypothetical protein
MSPMMMKQFREVIFQTTPLHSGLVGVMIRRCDDPEISVSIHTHSADERKVHKYLALFNFGELFCSSTRFVRSLVMKEWRRSAKHATGARHVSGSPRAP